MTNVRSYTTKELLDRVKSLPSFRGIPKGRWIINVRSSEDGPDAFDDKSYIMEGEENIDVMSCTTNPGVSILIGGFREFNKQGAFVVKTDEWYYDLWTYGLHHGKMPALVQVGLIKGYRDGNMNNKSEEIGPVQIGRYGINYHTNTYKFQLIGGIYKLLDTAWKYIVSGWSAGCLVVNDRPKFVLHMNWFKKAKETKQQEFVTSVYLKEF